MITALRDIGLEVYILQFIRPKIKLLGVNNVHIYFTFIIRFVLQVTTT